MERWGVAVGRILQIRVSAWTYNEDEVVRAWPQLAELVWAQLDRWGPVGLKHGVIELAEYLSDAIRFSDLSDEQKQRLDLCVQTVTTRLAEMRNALANWDPRTANALSEKLEDALTELEGQLNGGK
ncbi:hypothetical protein [uncultured Mailhella sp.]|uniref:hypothetical protein n=1 Tax=uncultured Mailhella sp. TaxID=1981031 RepID=UPI00262E612F|nr:hypothetical protein [uncultured Mailhella sp.]